MTRGKTRRTRLWRRRGRWLCWPASSSRRSTRSEGRRPPCCQTQRKASERPASSGVGGGSNGLAWPARAAVGWLDPFGVIVRTASPGTRCPCGTCAGYAIEQQAPLTRMRMQPRARLDGPAREAPFARTSAIQHLIRPQSNEHTIKSNISNICHRSCRRKHLPGPHVSAAVGETVAPRRRQIFCRRSNSGAIDAYGHKE